MHLRSLKRTRNEVSLYDPIGVDREGNEITLMDVLGSEGDVVPDQILAKDELEELLAHIERLGDKERKVIELRFGIRTRRRTQREIAKILGISRSYVSRIEKRAVHELGRQLEETRRRRRRPPSNHGERLANRSLMEPWRREEGEERRR
jgi:RNA polymerase sporulation-specific sigma factor